MLVTEESVELEGVVVSIDEELVDDVETEEVGVVVVEIGDDDEEELICTDEEVDVTEELVEDDVRSVVLDEVEIAELEGLVCDVAEGLCDRDVLELDIDWEED